MQKKNRKEKHIKRQRQYTYFITSFSFYQLPIDDIVFKKKTNAFWLMEALKRDNQFVMFTT